MLNVWGLLFIVWCLVFDVWCLVFGVWGLGFDAYKKHFEPFELIKPLELFISICVTPTEFFILSGVSSYSNVTPTELNAIQYLVSVSSIFIPPIPNSPIFKLSNHQIALLLSNSLLIKPSSLPV
jgi:hypothetical protein